GKKRRAQRRERPTIGDGVPLHHFQTAKRLSALFERGERLIHTCVNRPAARCGQRQPQGCPSALASLGERQKKFRAKPRPVVDRTDLDFPETLERTRQALRSQRLPSRDQAVLPIGQLQEPQPLLVSSKQPSEVTRAISTRFREGFRGLG